jgi:hypothetical protein
MKNLLVKQRRDVEPASKAVSCKKKLEDVLKERNGLRRGLIVHLAESLRALRYSYLCYAYTRYFTVCQWA